MTIRINDLRCEFECDRCGKGFNNKYWEEWLCHACKMNKPKMFDKPNTKE